MGDVSDFLKREQDALGGDFGATTPASASAPAPSATAGSADPFFSEDFAPTSASSATNPASSASNAPVTTIPSSSTPGHDSFGSEAFGDNDNPFGSTEDGESVFYVSQQKNYVDPYAALSHADETPEPIQAWRAKRDSALEAKDQASKQKVRQMEADAKAAQDKFNKEYQAKKDAIRKKNRDAQAAIVSARDTPPKGNSWERVYNLVDLTPKGQKSIKDVSRIRAVLTQLKTDPRSPGAA